mmetsp:Transcript_8228/g.34373  ORF Transcript_8228/g.34373 Transcript_8228/m.34373 type:complete len:201 (+) Transcript_8228:786-1388(+)
MHGWLSAQSTHTTGPGLQWSSRPSSTSPSTPMPGPDASSLAMNTHVRDVLSSGLSSASCEKSVVISATWPRQSVVPRPKSLSPSTVKLNGSTSQASGLAGTTSKWLPTKLSTSSAEPVPGYLMIKLPRPSVYVTCSISRGPPFSFLCGARTSRQCLMARSSWGTYAVPTPVFCRCSTSPMRLRSRPTKRSSLSSSPCRAV